MVSRLLTLSILPPHYSRFDPTIRLILILPQQAELFLCIWNGRSPDRQFNGQLSN